MPTTLIKYAKDMERRPLLDCHEGKGPLDWTNVLSQKDLDGRRLRFLHQNILHPGDSIGVHAHSMDEEYYFILSGSGTMTLDDQEIPVSTGDVTAVFPGGSHGLVNSGSEDLLFIVFSVRV